MIQRIQSIYLLLAGLTISSIFFIPLAEITYAINDNPPVSNEALVNATFIASDIYIINPYNLALYIPLFTLILFTLFFFKNRKKQIILAKTTIVASIITIIICLGGYYYIKSNPDLFCYYVTPENIAPEKKVSIGMLPFILPFNTLFLFLAFRAIKKDEELVRSADRIR